MSETVSSNGNINSGSLDPELKKTTPGSLRYKGRFAQTLIYLGKFLRMFAYQNDWKVLPMGALIAAVVTLVVGQNLFVTQEGTINGSFALTCCCIWNGFFNSIQVVCRERGIVKREHRAGLHVTSYIAAHMIYQLILCLAQTGITLAICRVAGVKMPAVGVVTRFGILDLGLPLYQSEPQSDPPESQLSHELEPESQL